MKKLSTLILAGLIALSSAAQHEIESYFGFSDFNTPAEAPYVEAYFAIDASTLTFVPNDGQWQAGAEITVLFSQDGKVVNFDKFNLFSEIIEDTSKSNFNVLAMRRVALNNGTYEVEVAISDINRPSRKVTYPSEQMTIDYKPTEIGISDIRLVKSIEEEEEGSVFNKNGLHLFPYLVNYYPTSLAKLNFYSEIYNLDEAFLDEDILVTYGIYEPGGDKPVSGLMQFAKQKGQEVNVVIGSLDLRDLPSGKYEFKLEVRNRGNKLMAERTMPLYRTNKKAVASLESIQLVNVANTFVEDLDPDKMEWYLNGLKPIASDQEERAINIVLEAPDTTLQRQFFYNFWTHRNLRNPKREWNKYHKRLRFARSEFRVMNRNAYQTDRGRVYLQYGEPTERFESQFESNSSPYEIWRYNRTHFGETNVIFVFNSVDLVSNDFQLIHSSATGEIKNNNWQSVLDGKFPNPSGLDPQDPRGSFGNSNSNIFDRR